MSEDFDELMRIHHRLQVDFMGVKQKFAENLADFRAIRNGTTEISNSISLPASIPPDATVSSHATAEDP